MSVVGSIDHHGAIHARACPTVGTHGPEESKGKRWRWLVWSQEFHACPPLTLEELNRRELMELTDEEHFAVCDWLIRHGYASESILPND